MTDKAVALVERGPSGDKPLSAFASEGNFEVAQRMARALSKSDLVPKNYQGDKGIPNILVAMQLANRMGADPMMVMQNLDIIHGRPGWRSSFLIATVNASGNWGPLRYVFQGSQGSDDWGCRAIAVDRESGEVCEGTLITMRMAKAEGWLGKTGSKWATMPEQMLRYRAAAFWVRAYAPELSLGLHTADEVEDFAGPARQSPAAADLNAALADEVEIVDAHLETDYEDATDGDLFGPEPEEN